MQLCSELHEINQKKKNSCSYFQIAISIKTNLLLLRNFASNYPRIVPDTWTEIPIQILHAKAFHLTSLNHYLWDHFELELLSSFAIRPRRHFLNIIFNLLSASTEKGYEKILYKEIRDYASPQTILILSYRKEFQRLKNKKRRLWKIFAERNFVEIKW